ncbi:hypothetical protein D0S48_08715 [Psychrobacillus sp. AK 1817]|nr:hypothetical protein D0S48_08715 [Psychrobacillus sp. AK 1817]
MEITNKRKFFQWGGYFVITLTLLLSIVLNISENTLDAFKWTGLGLGVFLTLISFLFPDKK